MRRVRILKRAKVVRRARFVRPCQRAKSHAICHMRKTIHEERARMCHNYNQRYVVDQAHQRRMEAAAHSGRLRRWLKNSRSRIWNFTTVLTPHVVGGEAFDSGQGEKRVQQFVLNK